MRTKVGLTPIILWFVFQFSIFPQDPCLNDTRTPSYNPAVGRVCNSSGNPIGTCWIAPNGKLVTASHVSNGNPLDLQVQFNVYDTNSIPLQVNTYCVVSWQSSIYVPGDEGNDWAVFEVSATNGKTPIERQNAYLKITRDVDLSTINTIRITGHGGDDLPPNYHKLQQTATGPKYTSSGADKLIYQVFADFGNSGSPMIDNETGYAVGILHGGVCLGNDGIISEGTSIFNSGFWNALGLEKSVLVDQKREDNSKLTNSNIGRWKRYSNSFENNTLSIPNLPLEFTMVQGDDEVLKGDQNLVQNPNEKYIRWKVNNGDIQDVKNHHIFSITSDLANLTSQFKKTYTGIIIKNNLEATGVDGGSVEFKDPWFIDYADPDYGNTLRNGGMEQANWRYRASPFSPNSTTLYENGQKYNGVFLDQSGPPLWNPPYYTVRTPQEMYLSQTGRTHKFYLQSWTYDPNKLTLRYPTLNETPVVFKTSDPTTLTANLKGTQLSNNIEAYSSNSQKKFIRTENGYLHNVYTSIGALWYEISTDGGTTWVIANNGKAINSDNPKGVSIDFLPPGTGDNVVTIAYQCTTSTGSKVVVDVFKNGLPRTPSNFSYTVISFNHPTNDYSQMNAEPVVSVSSEWDVMVVYKVPAFLPLEGNPVTTSGLYYSFGWLNGTIGWDLTWYSPTNKWVLIPSTNSNSIHPSIADDIYSTSNPTNYFHIAYQENNQIKYYYKFGQVRTGSLSQNSNPICISCNNGFTQNYSPSIIAAGQTARVCWVGYRLITQEEETEIDAVPQYKVLFKDPFNTSRYWQFGNDVSAPSFNRSPNYYAFGWREASNQNKFADNTLSTPKTLNTTGQELQICNGTDKTNMYAMAFNHTDVLPYHFLMSDNLGSFYSPAKITTSSFGTGREGIVAVDNAEFYFALGDINIDGQTIDFEEISDTVSISDITTLNQNLITKPMNISDNSIFVYSVQYGIKIGRAHV